MSDSGKKATTPVEEGTDVESDMIADGNVLATTVMLFVLLTLPQRSSSDMRA